MLFLIPVLIGLALFLGDRDENHLSPVGPGLSTDSPRLSAFSLARPLQDSDSMNREPKRMRTEAPPSPQPEPVEKTPAKPEATVTSTNIKISSQGKYPKRGLSRHPHIYHNRTE